jgi:chromosome segregation ATPase
MSTPAKSTSLLNLLDFELPPAPTPRSLPTITIRELESMKSQYQSQISSLKATLSGREAEVDSLKKAVGDAERRVGEALENLREERGQREQIEHEKNQWEQRGVEFEHLLQTVREEVMRSDEEKESLIRRAEESERVTEKQQTRADEAESKILDLEAQLATARAAIPKNDGSGNTIDEAQIQTLVQQQIDAKVEAVSRELHAVYKKKHETKVATLKKSYELRSEKKCADLQSRLDELAKQNEDLAASANNNIESSMMFTADDRRVMEEANATIEEQRAHLANLDRQLQVMRNEQTSLISELEKERVEKGELVAAVDEMLLLQTSTAPDANTAAVIEDFRRSISRPAPPPHAAIPAFREPPVASAAPPVQSRIGRGMPRPSGLASKSKMMSNIERMGGAPKH